MMHIRKINTLYGQKYAIVDLFTFYKTNVNQKTGEVSSEKKVDYRTVDYKKNNEIYPAIFEADADGLKKAKEIQKLLKK